MKQTWTPADVEAETLAGYFNPDRLWPAHPRLDAWYRAVSLGGEHYEAWREAHIAPIERSRKLLGAQVTRLRRGLITELVREEELSKRLWLETYADMTPEERIPFRVPDGWKP